MSFAQEAGGMAAIRRAQLAGTAKGTGERQDGELYETPVAGTLALLERHGPRLSSFDYVWEPACGYGQIARTLDRHLPCGVVSTDIQDYGYGQGGVDFLRAKWPEVLDPDRAAIITNPPFSDDSRSEGGLAARFIRHALVDLGTPFLAVLVKAGFWHAASRLPLFNACKPSFIHPLTFRLDFTGEKKPFMETQWVVWDRIERAESGDRDPLYQPLIRPGTLFQPDLFGEGSVSRKERRAAKPQENRALSASRQPEPDDAPALPLLFPEKEET